MSSLVTAPRFPFSAAAKTGVTAAVIEEARRRQRRRRVLGTVTAVALAVTAGAVLLGLRLSGQTNGTPVATHGRFASPPPVKLYLRRDASPNAIRNTIASLRHERARPSIVMHLKRLPIVEHIDSHPNGY